MVKINNKKGFKTMGGVLSTKIDFDIIGSEIPYRRVHETGFTQKML